MILVPRKKECRPFRHNWGDWHNISAIYKQKVCADCGKIRTKRKRKCGWLSHDWGNWYDVDTVLGGRVQHQQRRCKVCSKLQTKWVDT